MEIAPYQEAIIQQNKIDQFAVDCVNTLSLSVVRHTDYLLELYEEFSGDNNNIDNDSGGSSLENSAYISYRSLDGFLGCDMGFARRPPSVSWLSDGEAYIGYAVTVRDFRSRFQGGEVEYKYTVFFTFALDSDHAYLIDKILMIN